MSATCAWIIIFCMKVEKDVEIGSATKKIIVHTPKLTSRVPSPFWLQTFMVIGGSGVTVT